MPRYIYPPHPKLVLPHASLPEYEATGKWLWQRKFNGDRCVAAIENGKCHLGNRHGKWHTPICLPTLREELLALNLPAGMHYLDGELLHPKIDQTLVLFDVLQYGQYLIGVDQVKRLEMLAEICRHPTALCGSKIAFQVSPHVWLAEWGDSGFSQHYQELLDSDFIEGLVLRRKDSTLDNWGAGEYDASWQVRVRKPSKKYSM